MRTSLPEDGRPDLAPAAITSIESGFPQGRGPLEAIRGIGYALRYGRNSVIGSRAAPVVEQAPVANRLSGTGAAGGVPEGIVYSRIDLSGRVLPYGGQAQSEGRFLQRQIEHARNYPNADFEFTIVARANPGIDLDIAEHLFIQQLTGGVRASRSPLVSNFRDPVGPARRPWVGLIEPRNR